MLNKLEEKMGNPLICAITKGITLAATVVFAFLTLVIMVVAIFANAWWFLALIPCGILTGAGIGFLNYLFEEF